MHNSELAHKIDSLELKLTRTSPGDKEYSEMEAQLHNLYRLANNQ